MYERKKTEETRINAAKATAKNAEKMKAGGYVRKAFWVKLDRVGKVKAYIDKQNKK